VRKRQETGAGRRTARIVRLVTATALSIAGLPLLVTRWPAPMIGLAFLCVGAWLAISAARRRPVRGKVRR